MSMAIGVRGEGAKVRALAKEYLVGLQQLLDARRQLRSYERLGNVIVKPTFETLLGI